MGKKDTCPVCSEKVDLKAIFSDRPWETTNLNWNQMLDMVRTFCIASESPTRSELLCESLTQEIYLSLSLKLCLFT